MQHFMLRLIPIRPTFAYDISDSEREVMERHAAYCRGLIEKGAGFLFGPVFDPAGVFGLGVLKASDESEARTLTANDPAVIAGLGHYEIVPMGDPIAPDRAT